MDLYYICLHINHIKFMKTAMITGASSGIGLELAKIHAANGDNLVLIARSTDKLAALKTDILSKHKIQILLIEKDLSKTEAAQEVYDSVKSNGIAVDYLINNAGFGDYGLFAETNWEKELQMVNLNIITLLHLSKLFVKDMIERKSGKIMNVASTAAFAPGPFMAVYFASKAFVLHFSEAINEELKPHCISVTALCPGPTESGFQEVAAMQDSKLVKGKKLPSSEIVARYGYDAMMKGKAVAIHGLMNKILANSVRFTPRWLVVKITVLLQKK